MARCKRCNVTISDNTNICPLCYCAVEGYQTEATMDQYPKVYLRQKIMKRISNILLAIVLISAVTMVLVNATLTADTLWCIVPISAIIYVYLIFTISFVSNKGYRLKIVQAVTSSLALLLIIDLATGYNGWVLNYVLPSLVIITDVIIIILMLVNLKEWQSYLIMEIAVIGFSIVPIVLWLVGAITSPTLTLISVGIAVLVFLVSLVIGEGTAKSELKRRFHIK